MAAIITETENPEYWRGFILDSSFSTTFLGTIDATVLFDKWVGIRVSMAILFQLI
jgi:hypothetical protein